MPTFETAAEYGQWIERWDRIDAVISGKIKEYNHFIRYLVIPTYSGTNDAQTKKSNYVKNARLLNVSLRTLKTMRGMVAGAESGSVIELPSSMEYMFVDASGSNQSLEQLYLCSVFDVAKLGRQGLLVDMQSDEVTQADINAGVAGSRIIPFDATQIVNWHESVVGSRKVLTAVSLLDEWENAENYTLRELALDDDGLYVVTLSIYEKGTRLSTRTFEPTMNGQRMRYIPFFFIGSTDNSTSIDTPPIESLVDINIGHLSNSAETEEAAFYLAPTGFVNIGEMNVQEYKEANPDGITLGAAQVGVLGNGGSFSYIQPNPSNLSRELMADKERQMAYIGGQMIGVYTPETAEAARIQKRSDMASLTDIVSNVEAAYRDALKVAADWNGAAGEVVFSLPRDFMKETIVSDAALQMIINGTMAGSIPADVQKQAFEQKYPSIEYPDIGLIGNQ